MERDTIMKRIAEVDQAISATNKQIEQLAANLNMLHGGKQECIHWLNKLREKEEAHGPGENQETDSPS